MTDRPAVFRGTFSDCKIVKGRRVAQFVIEVPLEEGTVALEAMGGLPNPANEVWVAVARIEAPKPDSTTPDPNKVAGGHARAAALSHERRSEIAHTAADTRWSQDRAPGKKPFNELPLSQQAALLCQDQVFRNFLEESYPHLDSADPAETVRFECGVKSRSEFDHNKHAADNWTRMRDRFFDWKRGI